MWKLTILLTIIIAFLLEPLLVLPLLLLVVIAVSSFNDPKTGAFVSVISGLLSDIGMGRPLGLTVIFFLIISFIIVLYKRTVKQESLTFLFLSAFIAVNLYLIIFKRTGFFFPVAALVSSIIVVIITVVLYSVKPKI